MTLAAAFASRFGATPEAAARAPGRVTLMGDHTDYDHGLCLPVALPCTARAAVSRRRDRRVRLASGQLPVTWEGVLEDIGPGTMPGWTGYAAGVLWALEEQGLDVPGVDLLIDSDVPVGAGLSSSAAVEVAVALAMAEVLGLADSVELRETLIGVCVRAETEIVGAPTGGLDQTSALFGVAGGGLRLDFDDGSRRPVALDLAADGLALLVVDTRVSHALVEGGYGERRAQCRDACLALGVTSLRHASLADARPLCDPVLGRRTRHVVSENARVDAVIDAIDIRDWSSVGRLLDASHESLRRDCEVSCAELDLAVSAAVDAGALGARMTGGGFGGSVVALVDEQAVDDVIGGVTDAFAHARLEPPHHLVATPSAAATVIDVE